jgi:hypothetical protein
MTSFTCRAPLAVPPARKEPVVQENPIGDSQTSATSRVSIPARVGAAGKALIVYLATGSVGAALVAFLLFKGAGC